MFTFINVVYKNPYVSRCLFHVVKQMKLKMQPIGCKTHPHDDALNKRNNTQLRKKKCKLLRF